MRLIILVILVSAVAPHPVAFAVDDPPVDEPWIEVETGEFRLVSEAGAEITRAMATRLREFETVLAEMTDLRLTTPIPLHIVVFRDDRGFGPYRTHPHGQPANIGGYFLRGPDAAFIAVDAGSSEDPAEMLFHEYVHAVLADNVSRPPLWFGEGMACFFESVSVDGSVATIGLPVDRLMDRYRGSALIPMHEFLALDRETPHSHETSMSGLYYFQSWALVHQLLVGDGDRPGGLDRFFSRFDPRKSDPLRSQDEPTVDDIELQSSLERYLSRPVLPTRTIPLPGAIEDESSVTDADPVSVLCLLGRMLASHSPPRSAEAAEHFEEALRLDPGSARAYAGLASIAETDSRLNEASALYERALELDPMDGWIQYRLGAFLFQRTTERVRAITVLERSLTLDPAFGPAWAVLATAYAEGREPTDRALMVARHAADLFPSNPELLRALLFLKLAADHRDQALRIITTAPIDDDGWRDQAKSMVVRNDLVRANDAIVAQDFELAATRLELARNAAAEIVHDPDLHLEIDMIRTALVEAETVDTVQETKRFYPLTSSGEIEALNRYLEDGDFEAALALLTDLDNRISAEDRSWIDAKIEEIRRAIDHNRFAVDYNRAVDAVNEGDPKQAETILSDLLEVLPEGRDADATRALLDRIRKSN